MTSIERAQRPHRLSLDPEAAELLADHRVVRDLDRSGHPHFLIEVPDLDQSLRADVGVEIDREEDGCVALSLLVYDIPTEPVSYDLRFYPDQADDLRFLWRVLEAAQFRVHPCQHTADGWRVGTSQAFRLPPNVLLRLKHYSLGWPRAETAPAPDLEAAPDGAAPPPIAAPVHAARGSDPRDTVIRKLKEQVQALREQLQERDKRIIELEDELHEFKSRGRSYRLSGDKKPWWKPF